MKVTLQTAIENFGAAVKAKLKNVAATGEPEDQLRAPLEELVGELVQLCGFRAADLSMVGESSISEFKTRPDYAVTIRRTLVGFIEAKAPGKGADPRRFRDKHDKEQWEKLQSLPNLLYTDGNEFALCRSGEVATIIRLDGDVATSGADLQAPPTLQLLFEDFLRWDPIPPRNARQLAELTARLCRLLRDEVVEQMAGGSRALTSLAEDWRAAFFPDASDEQFADGYAQAVTFGMLMARARGIALADGLDHAAKHLRETDSLIGSALRLLTDDVDNQKTLKTSLGTLIRVLDVVHWSEISRDKSEAWLYFYEDFLEIYDNELRKKTGSYYTPPDVVRAMIRLVDEALQSRFGLHAGLASPSVTVADPALGTGTFLLGLFRFLAQRIEEDEGEGAVAQAIQAAVDRIIGFELQFGPFVVAQLRILAELVELTGKAPKKPPRLFVANTLSSPYAEEGWLPSYLGPIAESRKEANSIKRREPITVVIGNPPYKDKAKGLGGWIEGEGEDKDPSAPAPLAAWFPPREWRVGAHAKHLRNLYVYFWRWATWKVFDQDPDNASGIVCFITVAGFLNGPGFEKMRDDLRRKADDIWVIDCSPDGHRPEVSTRIFQGVMQPVCIVLASRSPSSNLDTPARVRYRALPLGPREDKFKALRAMTLDAEDWTECPTDWRAPFLPKAVGAWATFPALDDLFLYNGSGVMPGRTWVIAPDQESLQHRWEALVKAPLDQKEGLFHPHLRKGQPGDKHVNKIVTRGLPGYPPRPKPFADESGPCPPPVPYGYRTLDRQWIIPDSRLINQPNPTLWEMWSSKQVHLTALERHSPSAGPAVSFTAMIPDLDHYNNRGGRAFPLWRDEAATEPNVPPGLLAFLAERFETEVPAGDVMAYVGALAGHPAYTRRFADDLARPGLRIPITADAELFAEAVEAGRRVIWLHTFGERFADPAKGRPFGPPRLSGNPRPRVPKDGAIPTEPDKMPDEINFDESTGRLLVGSGWIEGVTPAMWAYEVSGKHVIRQWFSYRKEDRSRPIIGDRRQPSKLGDIQPGHWLAEYTSELINLLHVLGFLIDLEPTQAALLDRVCSGPLISIDELQEAGALADAGRGGAVKTADDHRPLFD